MIPNFLSNDTYEDQLYPLSQTKRTNSMFFDPLRSTFQPVVRMDKMYYMEVLQNTFPTLGREAIWACRVAHNFTDQGIQDFSVEMVILLIINP